MCVCVCVFVCFCFLLCFSSSLEPRHEKICLCHILKNGIIDLAWVRDKIYIGLNGKTVIKMRVTSFILALSLLCE